jgi:hypothetical protein
VEVQFGFEFHCDAFRDIIITYIILHFNRFFKSLSKF